MKVKKLNTLLKNQSGVICSVSGDVYIKRRLLELGFVNGERVKVLNISPLKNTYLIGLQGYVLALRKNSLQTISVVIDE